MCSRLISLVYSELDEALKAGKVTIDPDLIVLPDFKLIREYVTVPFDVFNAFKPLPANELDDENDILVFNLNFGVVDTFLPNILFKFFFRIKLNFVFGVSITIFSILFVFVSSLSENPHPLISIKKLIKIFILTNNISLPI
jgi:hypothetical protein